MDRDKRWATNARRIGTALCKAGIFSRESLLSTRFDRESTYQDIYGIGPIFGPQLRDMVNDYVQEEWESAVGQPWDEHQDDVWGSFKERGEHGPEARGQGPEGDA